MGIFSRFVEGYSWLKIYPVVSLVLFIVLFVGMAIWVFRIDRKYLDSVKNLPLDDEFIEKEEKV